MALTDRFGNLPDSPGVSIMSRYSRLAVSLLAFCVVALAALRTACADAPASALSQKEMEACWSDLEKEEALAARALLKLSTSPEASVKFLKGKMKPLTIDPLRIQELLIDLGSKKEETWKAAFEELDYFDPRLEFELEALMKLVETIPGRPRLVAILSNNKLEYLDGKEVTLRSHQSKEGVYYNFVVDNGSFWAEHRVSQLNMVSWGATKKKWTRAVRAIILLEYFNTKEAAAILKDMSTGNLDAQPTKIAKESLKKMSAAKG
jgi:hypothetical protein